MPSKQVISESFPVRLQAARKLREMDQATLARKAGLPASSISHFEGSSRKPSFDNLRRLANALEVTTDFLLGLVDDPNANAKVDPLYRDFQRLTEKDRTVARRFLRFLAEEKNPKGDGQ